jgi:hypothetical protein
MVQCYVKYTSGDVKPKLGSPKLGVTLVLFTNIIRNKKDNINKYNMKQKRFKIEYKDSIDMRCIQVIYGKSEKKAIQSFQVELLTQDDYMTQLIDIEQVAENTVFVDNKSPNWTLDDGTELDQDSQDVLNDAFDTFVNKDGKTIKQMIDEKV